MGSAARRRRTIAHRQEEDSCREQRGEHARAPPVEPLSLVERGEQQREAGAGVQESGEARFRSRRPAAAETPECRNRRTPP